jgi:hypothetical protein
MESVTTPMHLMMMRKRASIPTAMEMVTTPIWTTTMMASLMKKN